MKIMGKIVLTSQGYTCKGLEELVLSHLNEYPNCSVAIITTAAKDKENNKYNKLDYERYVNLGCKNVDFLAHF